MSTSRHPRHDAYRDEPALTGRRPSPLRFRRSRRCGRTDQTRKELLFLGTRFCQRHIQDRRRPELHNSAGAYQGDGLACCEPRILEQWLGHTNAPVAIRHDLDGVTKKSSAQGSVSPAARHSSTDPVDEFLESFGVMQEQALVQASRQVELPTGLRELVEDARGQGQPAFVIHAVFRTAVVSGHRDLLRSHRAPVSIWTLATTSPLSTTRPHPQTTPTPA